MQRYTYKLLKFSDVDGPYRGTVRTEDELELRVNQQIEGYAVAGWKVQNFSVNYVGGKVVYTILLQIEGEAPAAAVEKPQEAASPNGKSAANSSQPETVIPAASPAVSEPRPRRLVDTTTQLRPPAGPTLGEKAEEIRRGIEASNGPDYFKRALAAFDASLKTRVAQEKVPAEAIALRALKYRDQKNQVTFNFALCWLAENGLADRSYASLVPAEGESTAPAVTPTPEGRKRQTGSLSVDRLAAQQSMIDSMSSRYDLPDNGEPSKFRPRWGK
jgi:hypothetical protein